MAKGFARKFYNSTRWRKCAKAFAQSKLFVCEMCHNQTPEKIDGDQRYIVHHKIPLTPKNIHDPYKEQQGRRRSALPMLSRS